MTGIGHGSSRRPQYLPALDGLRGLAAMWVFVFHVIHNGSDDWTPGYLGVDLFFILSGFVLSHVYSGRLENAGDYGRFLLARLARIYPLHLATLLATGVVVALLPGFAESYPRADARFGTEAFLACLLLIQNWWYFLPGCWNAPAWSLSAEWAGYLLFPAFLFLAARVKWPLVMAFAGMAALEILLLAKGASPGATGLPGMGRMVFGAVTGCLTHRAWLAGARLPVMPATIAALLLLGIAHVPGLGAVGALGFPAFVLMAAREEGPIAQICGARPAVWLGEISYSIYLWHWLVLQIAQRLPEAEARGPIWYGALFAAVLLLSWASYHWIERPARRWVLRIPAIVRERAPAV
ncbi:acyltransferase family protein [Paracraurococcus lichenis]|uniref:Acyltransferase n=1 Tax=Paracraurococcus lichenis TaxID=3064888 RepID=A0ABT9E038_9PROT|nr:acyltransferase [Paracraurococcus sp. LOR1-02]MDO9709516.1 acyltransferase [Paracraurococcus sp. LOR1-02]